MLDKIKNFFMLKEGNGTAFYYGTIIFTALNYFLPIEAATILTFLIFMGREGWRWKQERTINYKTLFLGALPGLFSSLEPAIAPYVGEWFPVVKDFIVGLF